MSKPLYMQLADLQNDFNRQRTRNDHLREELVEAREALRIGHETLIAMQARAEAAEAQRDENFDMAAAWTLRAIEAENSLTRLDSMASDHRFSNEFIGMAYRSALTQHSMQRAEATP